MPVMVSVVCYSHQPCAGKRQARRPLLPLPCPQLIIVSTEAVTHSRTHTFPIRLDLDEDSKSNQRQGMWPSGRMLAWHVQSPGFIPQSVCVCVCVCVCIQKQDKNTGDITLQASFGTQNSGGGK
jgi:hypothetical protein